jgi:hypothetical protein
MISARCSAGGYRIEAAHLSIPTVSGMNEAMALFLAQFAPRPS